MIEKKHSEVKTMSSINDFIGVGSRIKALRKERGYTQKSFSEIIGVPYTTYSNYENDNREPSKELLEKISAALGVTVYDLFGIKPQPTEELQKEIFFLDFLESNGCKYIENFDSSFPDEVDRAIYWEAEKITIPLTKKEYELLKDNIAEDLKMELNRLRKQKGL